MTMKNRNDNNDETNNNHNVNDLIMETNKNTTEDNDVVIVDENHTEQKNNNNNNHTITNDDDNNNNYNNVNKDDTTTITTTTTTNNNNNNNNNNNRDKDNNDNIDKDGILLEYDVIICGTGLVQSIIASSLSRAGLSILHCDINDYYGEYDANYTLSYLLHHYYNNHNEHDNHNNNENNNLKADHDLGLSIIQQQQQQEQDDDEVLIADDNNVNDNSNNTIISLHPKGACHTLNIQCSFDNNNNSNDDNNYNIQYNHDTSSIALPKYTDLYIGMIVTMKNDGSLYKLIHIKKSPSSSSSSSSSCQPIISTNDDDNMIDNTITNDTSNNVDTNDSNNNDIMICLEFELLPLSSSNQLQSPKEQQQNMTINIPIQHFVSTEIPVDPLNNIMIICTDYLYEQYHIITLRNSYVQSIFHNQFIRSYTIDITPTLIMAQSQAVEGLVKSSVSDYLDFKCCEGLLFYYNNNSNETTTNNTTKQKIVGPSPTITKTITKQLQSDPLSLLLARVPCSKNDIFTSTILKPMEKRKLMKFLQLVFDYATAYYNTDHDDDDETTNDNEESTIKTYNEKHLNQGRSLSRPQNKAIQNDDMKILRNYMMNNEQQNEATNIISLEQYLLNDHHFSSSLIQLIRYALALEVVNTTTSTATSSSLKIGINKLCQHMMSLGKFGNTGLLIPLYGSGEISQAFCRSAAVYGTTYLLNTIPKHILIVSSDVNQNEKKKDDDYKVDGFVFDYSFHTNNNNETNTNVLNQKQSKLKQVKCSHVIVPKQSIQKNPSTTVSNTNSTTHNDKKSSSSSSSLYPKQRVLRRTSILSGKAWFPYDTTMYTDIQKSSQQQIRYVVFIPPNTSFRYYNPNKKQDEEVDMDIITSTSTIQAIFLDESVHVVPNVSTSGGCTMVHLTTTVIVDNENDVVDDTILECALQSILTDCTNNYLKIHKNNQKKLDEELNTLLPVEEIFHVTFDYEIDNNDNDTTNEMDNDMNLNHFNGLHLIHRGVPEIHCDDAFKQAERIYHTIMSSRQCNNNNNNTNTNTPTTNDDSKNDDMNIKTTPNSSNTKQQYTEFLTLSKELDQSIKERFGNHVNDRHHKDDDDEQYVLDSAVQMISSNTMSATTTTTTTTTTESATSD